MERPSEESWIETSTNAKAHSRAVVVAGDVTMDWNLLRTRRWGEAASRWSFDDRTQICWQRGGAAMLADLIDCLAGRLSAERCLDLTVRQMMAAREATYPGDDRYRHSYAMWSLFRSEENPPSAEGRSAWRVKEFLGHDHRVTCEPSGVQVCRRVIDDTPDAELVILDDAGLGFRDRFDLWPQAIRSGPPSLGSGQDGSTCGPRRAVGATAQESW